MKHLIGQFTIVGDGVFRRRFEKIASQYDNIVMTGVLDNVTTKTLMAAHDYLVLPSKYDGWGAVVNEALSSGIRVICSDSCGAEVLIDGEMRGESYSQQDLIKGLCKWLGTGPLSESSRKEIRRWAYEHISGDTASRYFTSFFATSYNQKLWYK